MLLVSMCNRVEASTCGNGEDPIPLTTLPKTKPRPRSVVYIPVECYYSNGEIYITGDDTVTGMEATVTDLSSNTQWSASSDDNYLQMTVSSASGDYYISITLTDGREYEGYYTLP